MKKYDNYRKFHTSMDEKMKKVSKLWIVIIVMFLGFKLMEWTKKWFEYYFGLLWSFWFNSEKFTKFEYLTRFEIVCVAIWIVCNPNDNKWDVGAIFVFTSNYENWSQLI